MLETLDALLVEYGWGQMVHARSNR